MKNLFFIISFVASITIAVPNVYADKNASADASAQLQTSLYVKEDSNRVKILKDYLQKYNSPLAEYAYDFIRNADFYDLDWRLVAAISGVESTFGKQIPYSSYNGWGWGVYGNNVIYFSSWKEGIETVSRGLRENYINKWRATNVYEIGRIYAVSPRWASNVTYFMEKIEELQYKNQIENLSISL